MFCAGLLVVGVVGLAAASAQPACDGGATPSPPAEDSSPPVVVVPPAPTATLYPTAAAALRAVLKSEPRVVAVGEFHQTKATARIPSALKRFTREMLAPLREAGALLSHAAVVRFSRIIRGWRAAILRRPMAGPSGCLRPCSQFRSVCTLIPMACAN